MESPSNSSVHNRAKPKNKLSCTVCRNRKIRCDRTYPCAHCVRSGAECVFPVRKRMQRPKKTKNSELLSRLSRLEAIVGRVDPDALSEVNLSDLKTPVSHVPVQSPGRPLIHPFLEGNETPLEAAAAAAPQAVCGPQTDAHTSKYLSGHFWANLCNEVGGLRHALEEPSGSDSDDDSEDGTPDSAADQMLAPQSFSSGFQGLLASRTSSSTGELIHPSPDQIRSLATIYFSNVDPILKILHKPTALEMAGAAIDSLNKSQEALLFAIYFGAVVSLPSSTNTARLGLEHALPVLCAKYQLAVERALAAADYLNNPDLECLQALVIYVACLRCHNGSRSSWVLVALLLRLAQAMDLHRDGDGSQFTPYIAELRRRLYWQIVVLDVRAAEDRGTEAMVVSGSYDTRLPLNLNDTDFSPDTRGPLVERAGPSDTTFSRCTAQSSGIFLYVGPPTNCPGGMPARSKDELIAHVQELEAQFITKSDPSHIGSYFASMLVRLINLKLWLVQQYPVHLHRSPQDTDDTSTSNHSRWPKVSHEVMLQTAISVMELQQHWRSDPYSIPFDWWYMTYVQWHPLAVSLAELCSQTRGPLVERSWKCIEDVFPKYGEIVAESKRGSLWRPIRKLYKKAKAARTEALREDAHKLAEASGFGRGDVLMTTGPDALAAAESTAAETISATTAVQTAEDARQPAPLSPVQSFPGGLTTASFSTLFQDPTGWVGMSFPDLSFDMPADPTFEATNWGVWNEFVNDYAGNSSKTSSSEEGG
ncbi:fungal-specific transcription factor domain-containing protein [Pseudomassariella vexata]|uniref:Fungal-specific transcription factor domain-domain-containing protein n=1 Tax=Pseudomassariella vexata TaxID=1141098 RepID=A0A1Y2DDG6_9PEZI|nr:fungal-specific transcription factor domain-containing protein [Pseudomassariella vexata]ORY57156.1 fungal-specific transcription factor domain-domain-containing protein [Pseudomassariella vexata]